MTRAAFFGAFMMLAAPLHAQRGASLYVGTVHARYANSITGTAGLLSGRFRVNGQRGSGMLEAGFSQFLGGEWTVQFGGQGTVLTQLGRGLFLGVAAAGAGNTFEGGTFSGFGSAGPLLAFASGPWLLQLGASAGAVRDIFERTSGLATLSGAAQRRVSPYMTVSATVAGTFTDSVVFGDATARISYQRDRLEIDLSAAARAGDLSDDPWGQGSIRFGLTPAFAVEATLGRYPRDVVGFTDGFFVLGGIRLNFGSERHIVSVPPIRGPSVRRVNGDRVRAQFDVDAPALQIAGDWNGWELTPLRRDDDGWVLEVALAPGVYRYALVDGDRWFVPEGAPTVPDDFGGTVALLIVE